MPYQLQIILTQRLMELRLDNKNIYLDKKTPAIRWSFFCAKNVSSYFFIDYKINNLDKPKK